MIVDKSNQRVQEMFGQIAPRYDLMNRVLSMNTDVYWRWWVVRKLSPFLNGPVLDVCTGTGDLAFAFARKLKGNHEVIGSDFCRPMLDVAERKLVKADSTKVKFVQADAQALPFADNSFQVVTVAFGLRNIFDTDQGLREMTRVCRPGGKVAVLEFTMPRRQPMKGMYGWYFRNILPRVGQLFARNSTQAYEYLPESVGGFPQYEALAERMQGAGLAAVEFFPLTFGIATLYVGTKAS